MGKKYQIGNVCLLIEKTIILTVYVDAIDMAGRNQILSPM